MVFWFRTRSSRSPLRRRRRRRRLERCFLSSSFFFLPPALGSLLSLSLFTLELLRFEDPPFALHFSSLANPCSNGGTSKRCARCTLCRSQRQRGLGSGGGGGGRGRMLPPPPLSFPFLIKREASSSEQSAASPPSHSISSRQRKHQGLPGVS